MPPNRILLADDHAVIRTGLKYLLAKHFHEEHIGEADSCTAILFALEETRYTHLILDLQLGDCNSVEIMGKIRAQYPDLAILVYTMSAEAIFGKQLIKMGVLSFLSKEAKEEKVLHALQLFLSNRQYLSEELKRSLEFDSRGNAADGNPFLSLSERELAVLNYLLQGLRVKEISNKLDIKMSTVATYKVRIFEKLGVDNVVDLQRLADVYSFG